MNKKNISFNHAGIKQADILSYVQNYSRSIFSKQGSSNAFSDWLSVGETDGLRLWLGVPEEWLTTNRQQYAEAVYSYTFGLSYGAKPEVWSESPGVIFKNPNKYAGNPDEIILDLLFIESFGIRNAAWESEVFHTTGLFQRVKRGSITPEQNFRCYMALAMFGFQEPEQFFTKD